MNGDLGTDLVDLGRVLALHTLALESFGGTPGGPKGGCVESAIGGAVTASLYAGPDEEPDPLTVAAYAFWYLARNQCFTDGNKRTAWLVLDEVLRQGLGVTLAVGFDEAYGMVLDAAEGRIDKDDVLAWLTPERLVELIVES